MQVSRKGVHKQVGSPTLKVDEKNSKLATSNPVKPISSHSSMTNHRSEEQGLIVYRSGDSESTLAVL